jgi:hypothetical protein
MSSTSVSSKVKKFMTLEEVESEDKGSVWVLNSSTGKLSGQILLSVPKKAGNGSDLVRVYKTFIPIDITTQVSRSQLTESAEFRKCITSGLLRIVTPAYAKMLLESEEGREEKIRIENELAAARNILNNSGVVEQTDEEEFVDTKAAPKKEAAKAGAVAQKLRQVVADASEEEWTQVKIVSALRNKDPSSWTRADWEFISKRYKDQPKVLKFLKSEYAEHKDTVAKAFAKQQREARA